MWQPGPDDARQRPEDEMERVRRPLTREADLASIPRRFPGVKFLVTPVTAALLDQQLAIAGRPAALAPEERAGYAREAAALLGQIAANGTSWNPVYSTGITGQSSGRTTW